MASAHEPMVSVVVPMYGVRDYIAECLDSLARQTLTTGEVEVVLVDDGSTDGTAEVAARYVADRPSWSLITQPNAGPGPGAARNRGLQEVHGTYVLFCDGDDVLEPEALEHLVAAATATEADVVVGAARQVPVPRTWRWSSVFEPLDDGVVAGTVDDFPEIVHHPAPGDKLFRTAFLRARGLTFGERIHHQDTLVTIPALLDRSRVTVLRRVVQQYRRRADGSSIMDGHYTREQNTWDHLLVVQTLASLRDTLPEARAALLDAFLVRSFQGFLARASALPRAKAEKVFAAARGVFGAVSPELVVEMTDGAVHALAYRAVLVDDLDLFLDPSRGASGIDLTGDGLRLLAEVEPPWTTTVDLGRLRGRLSSMTTDGAEVVFRGSVRVSGAPALSTLPTTVLLRLRGAGLTVPTTLESAPGAAALTVSLFTARVPLDDLLVGQFSLRVVLEQGESQRSGRVALPSPEPVDLAAEGLTLRLALDPDGAAVLEVAEDRSPPPPAGRARDGVRRLVSRWSGGARQA